MVLTVFHFSPSGGESIFIWIFRYDETSADDVPIQITQVSMT